MSFDLRSCVVAILHQNDENRIVGTGFVVDEDHILTCAHVIEFAGAGLGDTVRLKYEVTDGMANAEIIFFVDRESQDLAVLKLKAALPDNVVAAPLASFNPVGERERGFRAYGYHQLDRNVQSSYTSGVILGLTRHDAGFSMLQMSSDERIDGMSGGPVFDTVVNRVVGMVLRQSARDHTKVALPVSEIKSIWPTLPMELVFTVPFGRNMDFVGREEALRKIDEILAGNLGQEHRLVALTGMGGIGKTQLAVEYCYRHRGDFSGGILWINAASGLGNGFAECGMNLFPDLVGQPETTLLAAVSHYLSANDALLVIDNLPDDTEPSSFTLTMNVRLTNVRRLLVTTRRRVLNDFRNVDLRVLPDQEALELLLNGDSRRPIRNPHHPSHDSARQICDMLGYLPLALEIASSHLEQYEDAPLERYIEILKSNGALATIQRVDVPTLHKKGLHAVLQSQYEGLNDESRLLLQIAGQLKEAAVIAGVALRLLANLPTRPRDFFEVSLDEALNPLIALSLVEKLRDGNLQLHPLIRDFANHLSDDPETFRREREEAAISALKRTDCEFELLVAAGEMLISRLWPASASYLENVVAELHKQFSAPNRTLVERRRIARLLLDLNWLALSIAERLELDVLLEQLDLVSQFIETQGQRDSLLRGIESLMKGGGEILPHQRAQILIYQAQLLAQNFQFQPHVRDRSLIKNAEKICEEARSLIPVLSHPGSDRLRARIFLASGNVELIKAEPVPGDDEPCSNLGNALEFYITAYEASKDYAKDVLLIAASCRELSYAYLECGDLMLAEDYYSKARDVMDSARTEIEDQQAYQRLQALLLSHGGIIHYEKGVASAKEARMEFEKAYQIAIEEIRYHESVEGVLRPLVIAYINAGEYAQLLSTLCDKQKYIELACNHWRKALEIARRQGMENLQGNAKRFLNEHCPEARPED